MKSLIHINTFRLGLLTFLILLTGIASVSGQEKLSSQLKTLVHENSKAGNLLFKSNPDLKASTIFSNYKSAFGLTANDKMENFKTETDPLGYSTYRFQQYYKNIKVEFATVLLSEKDGQLKTMIGKTASAINVNTVPQITEANALQNALNSIQAQEYLWQHPANEAHLKEITKDPQATFYPRGELVIINEDYINSTGQYRLAYKFRIDALAPVTSAEVFVDAQNGNILHKFNRIMHADEPGSAVTQYSGNRPIMTEKFGFLFFTYYRLTETGRGGGIQTINQNHQIDFTNLSYFTDDDNTWDNVNANQDEYATDAHWAAETTYDYFLTNHARNSYDNAGYMVRVYVHYGNSVNNGFYSGDYAVIYLGDGDATCNPLVSLDFIGHEFTHGVTDYTAHLVYQGESGAINEAFSDIFAVDIEYWAKPGNYLLFEETYKVAGNYDRSMSNPKSGSPPQPDTYGKINWKSTAVGAADEGGVHYNSGIMNKWFYLLSEGGSGTNDLGDKYNVQGIGRDKAIKIAYRALTTKILSNAQFLQAREGTIAAAKDLFPGTCTDEELQTTNAWYAVGVGPPIIQIDSAKVEKSSCDEDNGRIYIRVKGVDPPPPTYAWSNGASTQEITDLAPGTYSVTITDPANSCKADTSITVEENTNFNTSVTKRDVTNCGGDDGSATLTVTGAVGTPDIIWSNGAATNAINDLTEGWYYVTVTDTSTTCTKTDSIEITEPTLSVTISGGGNRTYCAGQPRPTISLTASATHCTGCTYQWSTGATTSSITSSDGGGYSVVVTNSFGCSGNASTSVSIWERNCEDPPDWEIPIVSPLDPNEITGPPGFGPQQFIAQNKSHPYTILFENDPEFATAPALKVIVEAPFDNTVDMYSLRLGDFGFGDFVFNIPPNTAFYNTRLDLRDSLGVDVDVTAGIDVNNNKAFWILQSIDPATGLEPSDPNLGFLLVNDSITRRGEGFVSFTQKAKSNTTTGDTIHATGKIIFDANEAILTNTWTNVIDAFPPASSLSPLPAQTDESAIGIGITGSDDPGGSGINHYILFVSANGGPFTEQGTYGLADTIIFNGTQGFNYSFFALGVDNVGNTESMKTSAEATIHFNIYRPDITGLFTYDNAVSSPLDNVALSLKNQQGNIIDTTHSLGDGSYDLMPFVAGHFVVEASITKAWGGVNATDALQVMKHFTGIEPLSGLRQAAADVNASHNINAIDALLIAKRFTQLITTFAAGDWLYTKDTIVVVDSAIVHNFSGLCVGDVNGSYLPPSMKAEPTVRLFTENSLLVSPGQELMIPVTTHNKLSISAISLVINYPEDLLDIVDVVANAQNKGNLVYSASQGSLRIAWYSTEPMQIAAEGTVISLKVRAKNLSSTMIAGFSLGADCSLAGPDGNEFQGTNLYIPQMKIDIPMDFYLLSNSPNPFNVATTLEYGLPEASHVSLGIYNTLGEQLAVLVDMTQDKGRYKVVFEGSKLPEGVYYARFSADSGNGQYQHAVRMVLIRH